MSWNYSKPSAAAVEWATALNVRSRIRPECPDCVNPRRPDEHEKEEKESAAAPAEKR